MRIAKWLRYFEFKTEIVKVEAHEGMDERFSLGRYSPEKDQIELNLAGDRPPETLLHESLHMIVHKSGWQAMFVGRLAGLNSDEAFVYAFVETFFCLCRRHPLILRTNGKRGGPNSMQMNRSLMLRRAKSLTVDSFSAVKWAEPKDVYLWSVMAYSVLDRTQMINLWANADALAFSFAIGRGVAQLMDQNPWLKKLLIKHVTTPAAVSGE